MEALNGDSKSIGQGAVVTLMVSPMLVKAGDSYGEGYDMPETIEKSVVHVVSKYWEDNGYAPAPSPTPSPSPSPAPAPMSSSRSKGRDRGMSMTGMATAPESAAGAMVAYRAPSSRSGGGTGRRYVSRPTAATITEKMKEGAKKGKGKKWSLGGLKRRTAFKGARSEFYDGS